MNIWKAIKTGTITRIEAQAYLDKESNKFGSEFIEIEAPITGRPKGFIRGCRNKYFLVQIFINKDVVRLSINRATINKEGTRWQDGITWDEIQDIKNKLGYQDKCAVELYPPEKHVVDVANIRHIFILPVVPDFMWGDVDA